jgi:hypothetical protein
MPMAYAIYIAVKLFAYSLWCWVGLRWIWGSSSFPRALGFGVLRLVIGVFFGVAIFFLFPASSNDLLFKYVAIYAPVRLVEWLLIAGIFRWKFAHTSPRGASTLPIFFWCIGGILVSFVADFASPEGVAGHFCVGRCLC